MSEIVQSKFDKKKDAQAMGIISKFDMQNPSVKVLYGLIWFFLILAVLLCFVPPLWCMTSALKDSREFFSVPATIIPRSFHPEKLWETWEMLNFGQAYLNTIFVLCGSLIMSLVCNGMMGYVLSRLRPRGYKLVLSLVLWTLMLPQSVSQVPLFKNFLSLPILGINITESYLPMWLLAGANAFYVLIFKSFFDSIPQSLIEAARLDGCTNLGIFFRVMLPLSKPVLMVIAIFTINASWSDFFWPYLVLGSRSELYTVMVKIFYMAGSSGYSEDIQVVALIFTIIPPTILFLFFQRYIMSGFTLSGIKG
ncbi:MAG TPA: carbohydrate ABC transporter permease [Candidatus Spyradocola merdavium]|nr:carbohydrate ABC transporter permease [Candidatus Spyradocola merdavium]